MFVQRDSLVMLVGLVLALWGLWQLLALLPKCQETTCPSGGKDTPFAPPPTSCISPAPIWLFYLWVRRQKQSWVFVVL